MSNLSICKLSSEELDRVCGGEITLTVDKGYVSLEVSIGGYGGAVWATEGSICGQVKTPHSIHSGCTP
jgi:hypothetical protein